MSVHHFLINQIRCLSNPLSSIIPLIPRRFNPLNFPLLCSINTASFCLVSPRSIPFHLDISFQSRSMSFHSISLHSIPASRLQGAWRPFRSAVGTCDAPRASALGHCDDDGGRLECWVNTRARPPWVKVGAHFPAGAARTGRGDRAGTPAPVAVGPAVEHCCNIPADAPSNSGGTARVGRRVNWGIRRAGTGTG